jgi:hypothetical protein
MAERIKSAKTCLLAEHDPEGPRMVRGSAWNFRQLAVFEVQSMKLGIRERW